MMNIFYGVMMNERNGRQYRRRPARRSGTDHSSLTNDKKTKHYLSIQILSCVLKYKCYNAAPLL